MPDQASGHTWPLLHPSTLLDTLTRPCVCVCGTCCAMQGRKLASEHTREFIFARQQQPQPSSTAQLSGGFMAAPSQQQQQAAGFSPSRPKRRRGKVDRLLEDLREAERKDPRSGFKIGVVPKGGVEGLKGLAAFTSVLKTWSTATDQEQQQQEGNAAAHAEPVIAQSSGVGRMGSGTAAAGAVKVEQGLGAFAAPGSSQPAGGSQQLPPAAAAAPGAGTSAAAHTWPVAAGAAPAAAHASASAVFAAPAAGAATAGAHGPPAATSGPASGLQLQLPLLDSGLVDMQAAAADAALFGGMGLSSSEGDDDEAMMESHSPLGTARAVSTAAGLGGAAGNAAAQDSSEDWEDVEPIVTSPLEQQPQEAHHQQDHPQEQEGDEEQEQQQALGKPHGWRERMALRQKFWSNSHGFRLGRKLGDWAAAEEVAASQAGAAPAAAVAGGTAGAAAAAGGVVAAVIGGAVGRSPVKPQVARRIAQLGQAGRGVCEPEVLAVLGSDDEADAQLQAAIQLSLADAGPTAASAEVMHAGGAGPSSSDVVAISDDDREEWEDVEDALPTATTGAAGVAASAQEPAAARVLQEAADGPIEPTQQVQDTTTMLQQQPQGGPATQQQTATASALAGEGVAHANNSSAAAASAELSSSAIPASSTLAALYNGRSQQLLEQYPAVAARQPEAVASIRRDLLAAADVTAAAAEAREYPLPQAEQQAMPAQQETAQQQQRQAPQPDRSPPAKADTELAPVVATGSSGLRDSAEAAGSDAAAAAGAAAGASPAAADFSFLDQQPMLLTDRSACKSAAAPAVNRPPLGVRAASTMLRPPAPLKLAGPVLSTPPPPQQQQQPQQPGQEQAPAGLAAVQRQDVQPQEDPLAQQPLPKQKHQLQQQQQHSLSVDAPAQPVVQAAAEGQQDAQQMPPPPARAVSSRQAQQLAGAQQLQQAAPQLSTAQHGRQAHPEADHRSAAPAVDVDAELANLADESTQLRSRLTTAARNTATPTQVS